MKPYYEDSHVTIYHGNAKEIMPTLKADAVVTDPPFAARYPDEVHGLKVNEWLPMAQAVAPLVIFTTSPLTMWKYPIPDWVCSWQRPCFGDRVPNGGFNNWSPILIYGKFSAATDIVNLPFMEGDEPTSSSRKPIRLFSWIIDSMCSRDALIVDPFMGSGTTLLAARLEKRKCIGIEIDERLCEIAVERLPK